jgi:nitrite reductase/ring-hydroxylating ferredoxin subunit
MRVKIAKKLEIPSEGVKTFSFRGKKITVALVDGSFYAFDDACTHAECSLGEGFLIGERIVCPCHGAEFDIRTGEALSPPAETPLRTYRVEIEKDYLLIEL